MILPTNDDDKTSILNSNTEQSNGMYRDTYIILSRHDEMQADSVYDTIKDSYLYVRNIGPP